MLSEGGHGSHVGKVLRSFDLADRLYYQCRKAEVALFAAIADGSVATKTQAIACVQAATDGPFPATKFINVIIANCGSTWAEALAAAQAEIGE